jgi:uncharacterized Zn-finger protein
MRKEFKISPSQNYLPNQPKSISYFQEMTPNNQDKKPKKHPSTGFKCDLCDKVLSRKTGLVIHTRTHTQEKPFPCQTEKCGISFASKKLLNYHQKTHKRPEEKKLYCCEIPGCDQKYTNKYNLKRHHSAVHEDSNFQSSRQTSSPASITGSNPSPDFKIPPTPNNHSPRDTSKGKQIVSCSTLFIPEEIDKEFACDFSGCNKSFAKKKVLIRHKKIHNQAKPFCCDVNGCKKSFHEKSDLKRHRQSMHTDIDDSFTQIPFPALIAEPRPDPLNSEPSCTPRLDLIEPNGNSNFQSSSQASFFTSVSNTTGSNHSFTQTKDFQIPMAPPNLYETIFNLNPDTFVSLKAEDLQNMIRTLVIQNLTPKPDIFRVLPPVLPMKEHFITLSPEKKPEINSIHEAKADTENKKHASSSITILEPTLPTLLIPDPIDASLLDSIPASEIPLTSNNNLSEHTDLDDPFGLNKNIEDFPLETKDKNIDDLFTQTLSPASITDGNSILNEEFFPMPPQEKKTEPSLPTLLTVDTINFSLFNSIPDSEIPATPNDDLFTQASSPASITGSDSSPDFKIPPTPNNHSPTDTSIGKQIMSYLTLFKKPKKIAKKFACDFSGCDSSFDKKFTLTRHKKIHNKTKPFCCNFNGCEKGFHEKSDLKRHRKSKHNIDDSSTQSPFPALIAEPRPDPLNTSDSIPNSEPPCTPRPDLIEPTTPMSPVPPNTPIDLDNIFGFKKRKNSESPRSFSLFPPPPKKPCLNVQELDSYLLSPFPK